MKSVADELRAQTRNNVLAMTVAERIRVALALGDDDLALFACASGVEPDVARRILRRRRQTGRSGTAAAFDPA